MVFWFEPDDGLAGDLHIDKYYRNPKKSQRCSQNLWIRLFFWIFGFQWFFWMFWVLVESKKTLGNVWILLMSLVKIIIFSRFFLILL